MIRIALLAWILSFSNSVAQETFGVLQDNRSIGIWMDGDTKLDDKNKPFLVYYVISILPGGDMQVSHYYREIPATALCKMFELPLHEVEFPLDRIFLRTECEEMSIEMAKANEGNVTLIEYKIIWCLALIAAERYLAAANVCLPPEEPKT